MMYHIVSKVTPPYDCKISAYTHVRDKGKGEYRMKRIATASSACGELMAWSNLVRKMQWGVTHLEQMPPLAGPGARSAFRQTCPWFSDKHMLRTFFVYKGESGK